MPTEAENVSTDIAENGASENGSSQNAAPETLGDKIAALAEQVSAEREAAVVKARRETVEAMARSFAEAAARIRAEDSVTGIATALVEGVSRFCGRAALFIHRGDQLLGFRVSGEPDNEKQTAFQSLSIGVRDAAAAARAVESLAPVVTLGSAAELSQPVVALFGLNEEDRVHLMPVSLRDRVLAIIYCDSNGPDGDTAVLEPAVATLISLAEAWIEAVGTRRKQAAA